MLYAMLADLVVLVHTLFVLFVAFGGVVALRWRWLPAAPAAPPAPRAWVCPLTYLENRFRRLGGEAGYGGTFIKHYLEPVLYPAGLTQLSHLVLGFLALVINVLLYAYLWQRVYRK